MVNPEDFLNSNVVIPDKDLQEIADALRKRMQTTGETLLEVAEAFETKEKARGVDVSEPELRAWLDQMQKEAWRVDQQSGRKTKLAA